MDATRRRDPNDLPCLSVAGPEPAIGLSLFSVTSERPTGVAVLKLDEPAALHEATVVALAQLSTPLEVALEREMLLREVEVQRQKFYELAMHDPLTGLYNRLALKDPLKRLFAIQDRGEVAALAATMFDIDHFKLVNDTYGHAAGDEVLARVAATFAANARAGDLVARVGGEEFAVFHVVPDGMRVDALAERLRTEVAELRFVDDLAPLRVTVSAGVACRQRGEAYEELLARADTALYRAKEAGRNRTLVAPDPQRTEKCDSEANN
jgi:two-component system cell cycle response regulator